MLILDLRTFRGRFTPRLRPLRQARRCTIRRGALVRRFNESGPDHIIDYLPRDTDGGNLCCPSSRRRCSRKNEPGYVDLSSPRHWAGAALLLYNYDGDMDASDEGRMLAEMNDFTFRLGNVEESSYGLIMLVLEQLLPSP